MQSLYLPFPYPTPPRPVGSRFNASDPYTFPTLASLHSLRFALLALQYYVPWCQPGPTRPEAHDEALQERLWDWCERECEGF